LRGEEGQPFSFAKYCVLLAALIFSAINLFLFPIIASF